MEDVVNLLRDTDGPGLEGPALSEKGHASPK